ncbi:30S ribosomal protein S1 [Clostridium sp. SYSU_GA19001]|uniref:30S ribosomal protein S1 n=1 Tax=Clostridium caldaquaticum TaxID=2940653 RepID=UPI00207790AE|nr:30S ribosomal protein S1 [Clostridium caldaquaticum]MCM8710201.1 30S ribosomal protein S1 [Clostridium caldaquaticum]
MSEESMKDFMDALEGSMKRIHSGDIVKGKVISATNDAVFVNIGYMADGIISKEEFSHDEEVDLKEAVKPGDEIYVYILEVNDGEGNVALSKVKAEEHKVWDEFEESLKEGTTINVKINEVVKGGVTANVKGVRAFIPASQLALKYVEDLKSFVGKTLDVKVIELDKDKKKVVLSRKEVEKAEAEAAKDKVWASLKKGERRSGVVTRLAKFGAFVDLGGVDGLIHNQDLSWKRILDPSEVVKVGDKVEVYVIDFDKLKGRISLGLKEVSDNPWNSVAAKFKENDIVEGTVVRLTDFGAFVQIAEGIEGLVHISEIAEERVTKPSAVLNLGQKVKVKVLSIDDKSQKLSLSIKEAAHSEEREEIKGFLGDKSEGLTLGDLLKDKFKDFKFEE